MSLNIKMAAAAPAAGGAGGPPARLDPAAVTAAARAAAEKLITDIDDVNPKSLLHYLSQFANPGFTIQPAVFMSRSYKKVGGVVIPQAVRDSMKLPFDAPIFTHPDKGADGISLPINSGGYIINPLLAENVKEDYTAETIAGNAPIYMFILTNFGHASIIIYSSGMLYSVGLVLNIGGYGAASAASRAPIVKASGREAGEASEAGAASTYVARNDFIAEALIASPDPLIKPDVLRRDREGRMAPYSYTIVDIGLFKKKHLERIMGVLSEANQNAELIFGPDTHPFETLQINLNKPYSLFSSEFTIEQWKAYNCISFAQQIFSERVSCATCIGIVDPSACRSSIIKGDTKPILKEYMRKYQAGEPIGDLFDTLNSESAPKTFKTKTCTMLGGGRRRTRRTRHKLHRRQSRRSKRYSK